MIRDKTPRVLDGRKTDVTTSISIIDTALSNCNCPLRCNIDLRSCNSFSKISILLSSINLNVRRRKDDIVERYLYLLFTLRLLVTLHLRLAFLHLVNRFFGASHLNWWQDLWAMCLVLLGNCAIWSGPERRDSLTWWPGASAGAEKWLSCFLVKFNLGRFLLHLIFCSPVICSGGMKVY